MAKYVVYGNALFGMEVEGKSEHDARVAVLNKLMDLEGMRIEVETLEAEETDDGTVSV